MIEGNPSPINSKLYSFMKLIQNRFLLTIFALVLSITSCKKTDFIDNQNLATEKQLIEQFTKVPKHLNPLLQVIANKLNEMDSKSPFIIKLGNKVGVPLWDKVQYHSKNSSNGYGIETENSDVTIIVPLSVPNSNEVNGFIATVIDNNNVVKNINEYDKFNYSLLGYDKANTELDAEDVALQSLILQNDVFGNATFKILDSNLFSSFITGTPTKKIFEISLSPSPPNSATNSRVVVIKSNHCTHHDGIGPNGHEGGDCDECDWCGKFDYTIFYYNSASDLGSGGGFGFGGSNGLGGLGGGGWISSPLDIKKSLISTQLNLINPNAIFYFTNQLNPSVHQNFNSVIEFSNHLNRNTTFDLPIQVSETGNQKIRKTRVWRSVGGYDFFVKTEKDNTGKYSVKEVTADEFGVTLSWSFKLTSFASSINNPKTKPNEITIDIYGTENYNIIIEGIGTVYKHPVHYQITVDALTGEITGIKKI